MLLLIYVYRPGHFFGKYLGEVSRGVFDFAHILCSHLVLIYSSNKHICFFTAPHQDIQYTRGPEFGPKAGEASYITVQLYLNDKFKGGSTRFLSGSVKNPGTRYYDVKPKVGSVLIFDHDILHEGSEVKNGTKYSVRTDIMYTSTDRIQQQEGMGQQSHDQKQQRRVTSSVASLVEDRDPLGIFGNLSTDDAT